jgi:hypothetical protein
MAEDKVDKEKKTYTYTYTADDSKNGEDPFDVFEAFFGDKKKTEEKRGLVQKIKMFIEKHPIISAISFFFIVFTFIFLVFYVMSVSSWNNGKCLLLVPYFSSSTSGSCEGLDSAFSNAVYLSITFIIVILLVTILSRLNRK